MGPTRMRTGRPQSPRGLWAQLRTLILKPGYFFRVLPGGQTWLVVAFLLIMLTGVSEWQRQQRLATPDAGGGGIAAPVDGEMGSESGDFGGEMGGGMGETPLPPPDMGGGGMPGAESNVTEDLSKVLVAGSGMVVIWLINIGLLSLVTLTNGFAPRMGRSLRLAVWSTVPIGLMALFQLIFYAAGGKAGEPGLAGLLDEWRGFTTLPPALQSLVLSIASRMTIFYLWSAVLLYLGSRHALKGKHLAAGFAVGVWVILVITLPVITGAIAVVQPPQELPEILELPSDEMPDDGMMPDESASVDGAMSPTDEASAGENSDQSDEKPVNPPAKPADVSVSGRKG